LIGSKSHKKVALPITLGVLCGVMVLEDAEKFLNEKELKPT
jgi:hypothetical protein